jgi:hypothetical protein
VTQKIPDFHNKEFYFILEKMHQSDQMSRKIFLNLPCNSYIISFRNLCWQSNLNNTAHLGTVLLNFATSEDRQATFRGRKGLAGTKLGLDKDLTLTQQAHKSKLWPLFKEAKVASKCAKRRTTKLFINGIQICPPSSI